MLLLAVDLAMENSLFEDFLPQNTQPERKSSRPAKRKGKGILFFFLFVTVLVGGFLSVGFFQTNTSSTPLPVPQPSKQALENNSPSSSDSAVLSSQDVATPSPKPTSAFIDPETGLDKAELAVVIQNGSGGLGVGIQASEVLHSYGYHVISIGNADNFNYQTSAISIKSSKSAYLPLLKKDLSTQYTISTASANLSEKSSSDVVFIVGKE